MKVRICVTNGVEGPSVSVEDGNPPTNRHGGRRVGGPKPWGGGQTTHSWLVDSDELRAAIDEAERLTDAVQTGGEEA